ncbi:hypothetical protein KXW28_007724 [Aspergillus fumigatus]|jgi:HAMP domain-containing protein|nr:hypothetical protein KXX48_006219 [Aspergillus fumigatus]KAH1449195.1 hypothetical protein KXX68_007151 [Aspergillus fumigatus]KAH1483883.1 hypothetical protein KXX26_004157 [Aspergillus fumigatus]KAH1684669.1 hypothetical protein KXX46_003254 [Aspergillus fumigatus]KAH1701939.1 hypothetical protein KXX12_003079 [Aspergillus fumigatus]
MAARVTRSQSRKTSTTSCKRKSEPEDSVSSKKVAEGIPSATCKTPQRPNKRVRFSDPGLRVQEHDYSTGLTPALLRTSFEDQGDAGRITRSPSRRMRRRSAPLPRSLYPQDPSPSEQVVQFTPLRQILDPRTKRRLCRTGLSDEVNHIEREKRETAYYEKTIQSLLRERDALKQQLESARSTQNESQFRHMDDVPTAMSPRSRIEHLEAENGRLREEVSFSSIQNGDDQDSFSTTDTVIINDSAFEGDTILMSNSPVIRGLDGSHCPSSDNFSSLHNHNTATDVGTQAHLPDEEQEVEIRTLSLDLETARKEKRDLFNAVRAHSSAFDGTPLGQHLRRSSPPPDFLAQFMPALAEVVNRASDAVGALNSAAEELSSMGFSGTTVNDIISEMRHRFRSARLGLERALPGETANVGLEDGSATLAALVNRVELLVKDLEVERDSHHGLLGREKALRGQFDTLLTRYEAATQKIRDLEESRAAFASDMLHTRMRMQELEREGEEQVVSIDRLNAALSKYSEEVKGLEILVNQLEADKTASQEQHSQQVSQLEERLAQEKTSRSAAESAVAEREERIRQLEGAVETNQIRVCDLTAKVESIEKERREAIESLEQKIADQVEHHENEVGLLNARVSELTTALEAAKSEAEKLHRSNIGLREQLQQEMEARDNLLDRWAAHQARSFAFVKETVNSERRKAKIRAANWEMKSDDLHSDGVPLPSEPITPVSMTRFVDVEVGRGKNRRRLDSGIGILTEEDIINEVEDGADLPMDVNLLPSDPAEL